MEVVINPRILLLILSTVITILVVILVPAVPQDQGYHKFADQRNILGIPHFWNIVTNSPFIVLGITGFFKIQKQDLTGVLPELFRAYLTFFLGLVLTGLASGYYHLFHPKQRQDFWCHCYFWGCHQLSTGILLKS